MTVYSGTCGTSVNWTLDTDTGVLEISGSGAMTNYTTANHAPWYSDRSSITTVNIGDKITRIGDYTLYNCSAITSVTIPDSVTRIGNGAFYYCSALTSITIPNSVTSLLSRAFQNCTALKSITIPEKVTSIGVAAFYYCSALTEITFLGSQPTINSNSFVLGTSAKRVTATVYSSGWASNSVFTSSVKGSYTTFTYKPLPEDINPPNFTIMSIALSTNPVKTGENFILSVDVNDFSWDWWSFKTWNSVKTHTWNELKGE